MPDGEWLPTRISPFAPPVPGGRSVWPINSLHRLQFVAGPAVGSSASRQVFRLCGSMLNSPLLDYSRRMGAESGFQSRRAAPCVGLDGGLMFGDPPRRVLLTVGAENRAVPIRKPAKVRCIHPWVEQPEDYLSLFWRLQVVDDLIRRPWPTTALLFRLHHVDAEPEIREIQALRPLPVQTWQTQSGRPCGIPRSSRH